MEKEGDGMVQADNAVFALGRWLLGANAVAGDKTRTSKTTEARVVRKKAEARCISAKVSGRFIKVDEVLKGYRCREIVSKFEIKCTSNGAKFLTSHSTAAVLKVGVSCDAKLQIPSCHPVRFRRAP
jgi:hypothetical protein